LPFDGVGVELPLTETLPEARMLTDALADLVVSAALVAVTVTLPPEGTLLGAV
jgi:hypothetical protein